MRSPPYSRRIVNLKLVMDRLIQHTARREQSGITFIGIELLVRSDSIITDKLVVTDEAIKCLNVQT